MESIGLKQLTISYGEQTYKSLCFDKAELVVITQYGDRIWYIDVDGISDSELLAWFGQSENIRVEVHVITQSGDTWQGTAYFHPNEPGCAAAIRGDGKLTQVCS